MLLDINQAAKELGLPPLSLRGKISRREIKFVKIGRRVLFRPEDLRELIEKSIVEPKPKRVGE